MKKGIELAIERAVSGGYNALKIQQIICNDCFPHYLLDKDFWQALGKAEGWKNPITQYGTTTPETIGISYITGRWINEWHCFIDWIAEGKSIDSFFEELWQKKCSHGINPKAGYVDFRTSEERANEPESVTTTEDECPHNLIHTQRLYKKEIEPLQFVIQKICADCGEYLECVDVWEKKDEKRN